MSAVRSLLAGAEERFLAPMITSRRPALWRALYAGASSPFFLRGRASRWEIALEHGPVRVMGVGPRKRLEALRRITGPLGEGAPAGASGASRWDPAHYANESADLIAVAIHPAAAGRFRRAGWLIMPDVVRWEGELAAVPPARPCRSLRHDFNRIERFGAAVEATRTPGDWEEFFAEMVEPQAAGRFGESAWLPRPPFRRRLIRRGTLLFLTRRGTRVAGIALLPCSRERIWIPLIAIRGGDPALLAEGAMAAAISSAMTWARNQGYRTVDGGRTSSLIRDGVHVNKMKWGYRSIPDPMAHLLALRVAPACAALAAALAQEPFLHYGRSGLEQLVIPRPFDQPESASPSLATSDRVG